ncbi:MAG TPA: hypothetical protein PLF54_09810 [Deltaproteobacteria bacterium]|jgi:hypothetical protein|nr:hypothetical protein [Deltaproteobacteria bacterium]HQJ09283.1 hypothetical protein [Deltaproteobacteria bacterium]
MWAKVFFSLFLVLFILAGVFFMRNEEDPTSVKQIQGKASPVREAKNIVMYEKRQDSDWVFVVRAKLLLQETNELFTMLNFRMDRSDGMKIEGGKAKYNSETSLLKVVGPMTIDTTDGWRVVLTDLVWDRSRKYAVTDKPVAVQGRKGSLRGDRAEFFDDFNRIIISGDVHAKVDQSVFNDLRS